MFGVIFEGEQFGYAYEAATNDYLLFDKKEKIIIALKGDNAEMFRDHLTITNNQQDNTLRQRTEQTIKIHFHFMTKPCPIPVFVDD
jgi:hypothetical protein